MAEAWTLDGLALSDGTTFQIREGEIDLRPPAKRPLWATSVDVEGALLSGDPPHENRVIVLPLQIVPQTTKDLAFDKIGQIVDKLQKASATRGGIPLVWTAHGSTRSVTFDVLVGEVSEFDYDRFMAFSHRARLNITLTCRPFWYGTEVLTSTASSSTPFVTLEIPSVPGDAPAKGRLIVTDTASQSRRHVEWGLEGPGTYNASTSLLIDSDDMVTSGFAGTGSTLTGAYDPNAAGNSVISAALGAQPTAVCGTGNQSHVGSFLAKARMVTNNTDVYVRLGWQVGDGPFAATPWAEMPSIPGGFTRWTELDLGIITIQTTLSGTQRWTGRIEAKTVPNVGPTLYVDYLELIPVTAGYGKARATYSHSTSVTSTYDDFTGSTAGAVLNGRITFGGNSWGTSGAVTDFAFVDSPYEAAARSTVSDAGARFAILGATNYTNSEIQTQIRRSADPAAAGTQGSGVIGRWVDASNYLRGTIEHNTSTAPTGSLSLVQRVAGTDTVLATLNLAGRMQPNQDYVLRLVAFDSGRAFLSLLEPTGTRALASIEAQSSALATAGALATGKPGLYDLNASATAISRYYDNFNVATPSAEPIAIYSGRNMQIRHDGVIRQDSTGTYTAQPKSYEGDYFTVPPGTSRVLVKARRNDVDEAADDNVTDATQIQVGYTPRGLVVPR